MLLGLIHVTIVFQSTLPVRGATATRNLAPYSKDISIHAPRAGSDKENN